jgi:hypothetical protein
MNIILINNFITFSDVFISQFIFFIYNFYYLYKKINVSKLQFDHGRGPQVYQLIQVSLATFVKQRLFIYLFLFINSIYYWLLNDIHHSFSKYTMYIYMLTFVHNIVQEGNNLIQSLVSPSNLLCLGYFSNSQKRLHLHQGASIYLGTVGQPH